MLIVPFLLSRVSGPPWWSAAILLIPTPPITRLSYSPCIGRNPARGGYRFGILAVGQIVERPTIAVAQRMDDPIERGPTYLHPALLQQQGLQVVQRPDRHREAIGLRPAVEGRAHEGPRPLDLGVHRVSALFSRDARSTQCWPLLPRARSASARSAQIAPNTAASTSQIAQQSVKASTTGARPRP